jgi:TPR repeat protein
LTLLLVALAPLPCFAQGAGDVFGAACRAEVEGDHATAFGLYQEAAEEGIREAMFALGRYYRDGLASAPDEGAAFAWFREAAERGHALARYEVGVAYRDGVGTQEDRDLARQWLEAAALRHGPAAFAVFELETAPEEKGAWLLQAARLGDRTAMSKLARAYAEGDYGFAVSRVKSRSWRAKAEAVAAQEVPR